MKVAVVGATGLVGTEMLKVLAERNFKITELIPVATEKSLGKTVFFNGMQIPVVTAEMALEKKPNLALFSAGGDTSLVLAPKFTEIGCKVIDNSSAWRMHEDIKLVVPEVNADVLAKVDMIIANPNCSTIQLVVALAPLHRKFKINRLIISTYQSITGTGVAAVNQMENERNGISGKQAYPYKIDKNCIPHCDVFLENGYTKEEMKLRNETQKILDDKSIGISATAVRIPVVGGHSESVNISFDSPTSVHEIQTILGNSEGVILQDNPEMNVYPMPLFAHGKDAVFVGRIRKDESAPNSFNLWVVADNLRKGAATNAVQIAEVLVKKGLI